MKRTGFTETAGKLSLIHIKSHCNLPEQTANRSGFSVLLYFSAFGKLGIPEFGIEAFLG